MADDPDLISRVRSATPPQQEPSRSSAEARADTDDLSTVRAARVVGVQRTLPAAQQARGDALEANT